MLSGIGCRQWEACRCRCLSHRFHGGYSQFNMMEGRLPAKVLSLTVESASLHRDELMEDWELARQRGILKGIAHWSEICF